MSTSQQILECARRHAGRTAIAGLVLVLAGAGLVAVMCAPGRLLAEELKPRGNMHVMWAAKLAGAAAANMGPAQSTTKTLSTNFTMVNLSTSSNAVNLDYYKPDGTQWRTSEVATLAAQGDQLIRRQYDDATLVGSNGSVVMNGQGPLGAVVQILTRSGTNTRAAYSGVASGGALAFAPYIGKELQSASGLVNSQIIVQNTGDSATFVVIELISPANGDVIAAKNIFSLQPGASYTYDLATDSKVPAGFFGSAAVLAFGNGSEVAAIVNVFSGPDTLQTYNAFTSLSQAWSVPLFTSRLANSLSTPLAVQNVSGQNIPVGGINVTCMRDPAVSTGPASFSLSNTEVVPNWTTYFFSPVTNTPAPGMPDQWFGACRITTTGFDTVAMVQMRVVNSAQAGAYEAIKADGTHKKVVVPLYAKRLANGFASAVTIQNLNKDATANVTLQYQGAAGLPANCTATVTASIAAGGSLQQNHRIASGPQSVPAIGDGCYGTIVVTSADQSIDGIIQLTDISGLPGDTFQVHNAFATD
ncbi:MAG: hypothetical protein U0X20_32725 [Caldilineaceae bacterium]